MDTATQPTLPEPSADDVKEYGAVLGHCVLCQEPVHAQDLSMEDGQKPLCCQREVSEEWVPAFNNEKSVFICTRAPSKCTSKYSSKRDDGSLVISFGIAQEFRATLNTQPLVMDAIKGKLDISETVEVVIKEADVKVAAAEDEESPTPAATEEAEAKDVQSPDTTTPHSAVPAQPAGNSSEEPVQVSSDGDGTDAAKDASHADTNVEPTDVEPTDVEQTNVTPPPSLETPQDVKPINLHGMPAPTSVPHPAFAVGDRIFWYQALHREDGEWAGQEARYGSVQLIEGSSVGALQDGKDPEEGFEMIAMSEVKLHREASSEPGVAAALKPIVLENIAVEAAKAAIRTAPPAAALSVVKSWTPQSIKDFTIAEMGSIINKEGIHKEDVLEQCSSGSANFALIWAEKQGKIYPPWSPSLSSSVAVLACREDPLVADRHSSEACPRILLSSKVVLPTKETKSRTRYASPPLPRCPCVPAHVSSTRLAAQVLGREVRRGP
jgi:hypothetical protein